MIEKFNIPSNVLEAKSYRQSTDASQLNPFDSKSVVITSLHYASRMSGDIRAVPWDLVVIEDEILVKRDLLIDALEKRLAQKTTAESLFTIRWKVA